MEKAADHLAEAREAYMLNIRKPEDHLARAFTRLMMAMAVDRGYTIDTDEFAERDQKVAERERKEDTDA